MKVDMLSITYPTDSVNKGSLIKIVKRYFDEKINYSKTACGLDFKNIIIRNPLHRQILQKL